MENEALIRYACLTSPGMDTEGLAFPYLKALDETRLGVRVMPVGMVAMWLEPWNQLPHVFMSALKMRFINVVCVPPGVSLGMPISVAQFGNGSGTQEGAVYKPDMAISGLYTVGIPNVAVLAGTGALEHKEVESLKIYDAVVCPTTEGSAALEAQGIKAVTIPPEPGKLSRLFSGMNPI